MKDEQVRSKRSSVQFRTETKNKYLNNGADTDALVCRVHSLNHLSLHQSERDRAKMRRVTAGYVDGAMVTMLVRNTIHSID